MNKESPQLGLFDAKAGREARDEGISRVIEHNQSWLDRAIEMLKVMRQIKTEVTGEEIRAWLRQNGLPEPISPHAWGALIRTCATREILIDTHRVSTMKDKRSHARRTPVWRFS